MSASDVHNETATKAVSDIMHAVADGTPAGWSRALVILESVNVGVLLAVGKLQNWPPEAMDAYHRALIAAVRQRIAKSN